jgi:hypothetical protein
MSRTKKSGTAPAPRPGFNVVVVAQSGRLQYEAALFCASFRAAMPDFAGRLIVAEPQKGPLWSRDPRISDAAVRALVLELGAEIIPFESKHFRRKLSLWEQDRMPFRPARGRALRLLRQRHADPRRPGRGALRFRPPLGLLQGGGHLAADRAIRPRLHRDLEVALRPVRRGFRKLAGPVPARRVLAALPLFQRGLLLLPLPARLRVPVPGDRARHSRRHAAGTGLPVARPLARPGGAAARDPRPRRRARRASAGLAGRVAIRATTGYCHCSTRGSPTGWWSCSRRSPHPTGSRRS